MPLPAEYISTVGKPPAPKKTTVAKTPVMPAPSGVAPVAVPHTQTPAEIYQNQVLGSPGGVAAQGVFDAQATNLANARAAAIQSAIVNAGWTPDMSSGLLSGYASDVTPSTLAAAAANPMSQKAQLDLQLGQAKTNTPYDLAASGAGRSGALPITLGNLSRQYDTSTYQGMQDLLASITNSVNTYATGYGSAQNQLEAARLGIGNQIAQQPGYSEPLTPLHPGQLSSDYPSPPASPLIQAAQKAIKALKGGAKAPPNLYQILKNSY